MGKKFSYKRFAKKPGCWRVDGIGTVQIGPKGSARLLAQLSGIHDEHSHSPYSATALNGLNLAFPLHPANLRHFLVGSVWRNGSRIYLPQQEKNEVIIDTRLVHYYRLGDGIAFDGGPVNHLLPPSHLKMAIESYQGLVSTGYFVVPVQPGLPFQWMIVPASELLRFYLGTSERLLTAIVQGTLHKYIDFENSRVENLDPVLRVKKQLTRLEAFVLGRAVENEQSLRALLGVHKYLSKISVENKSRSDRGQNPLPFILRTEFPFRGITHLKVCGKRVLLTQPGMPKQWAIFAMYIEQCQHPLGFSKVVQESDIPWDEGAPGSKGVGGRPQLLPELEDADTHDVDDVPADGNIKRVVFKTFTNQFPGFARLKFEHERPDGNPNRGRAPRAEEVPIDNLTFAEGQYGADAANNVGLSGFDSFAYGTETDLEIFVDAIEHLAELPEAASWRIASHNLEGQQNLTLKGARLAHFPERIKNVHSWHRVVAASGDERPRNLLIYEIQIANTYFYACEMELKPNESQCTIAVFRSDFEHMSDKEFRELLILTAIRNRWPQEGKLWKKMEDAKRCERFFADHAITRIDHPSRDKDPATGQKAPINPRTWAMVLLTAIEEEVLARTGA
jgi:hypothetical protein